MSLYKVSRMAKSVFIHSFLLSVTVVCVFPLFWMFRSALMTNDTVFTDKALIPAQLNFRNFYLAWTEGQFSVFFFNSIIYTAGVVLGIVVVSSLAAYAFSRLKFPGRNVLFFMFLAAMMIPFPGSFVPLFVLMKKLHFIHPTTSIDFLNVEVIPRLGYILCMINVGLSLSILLFRTFFDKMPPDLEDAARIDGCSKVGIWWHVALPLARPAIAVVVIFNSLNVWNEYILATLLLNERHLMPLQRGLMVFQGSHSVDYPLLMAGLTIAAVPIILVYVLMQRHIIKGLASGAIFG